MPPLNAQLPELNLHGLPPMVGELIRRTLANDKCTPDAVLLIADALDECVTVLSTPIPLPLPIRKACARTASQLRDRAAYFIAPGKPLGDFDGTLTPQPTP